MGVSSGQDPGFSNRWGATSHMHPHVGVVEVCIAVSPTTHYACAALNQGGYDKVQMSCD